MKNKSFILLLVGLIGISTLFAQQQQVKGTVVDAATGEQLIGVKILEKGTNNGTITNFNGEFTFTVPAGAPIVVSYIGYLTRNLKPQELRCKSNFSRTPSYWMKWWW